MVDCFSRSDPALPPHERLAEGFSKAGHAITITTATSLTAFLIASSIDFPIISYFCFLGAMGILGVYIMQVGGGRLWLHDDDAEMIRQLSTVRAAATQ